ncbi:hypothetical protein SPRG_13958 [Saprolegnia parasitica CBS 223.65]|uniref:Calcineurin-like phosphoesterase domain-containing protein n=1 Tax=Saprolegnia parasitica (strain CBS 223.65) TaxID=695850 RepID=A0A067BW01_SAPPC|nr:hypothetical protein SPRG_13958 [Saprolegnia parasitica CBS 223.65]KDO21030.1 hypothetical protein SPRG_13958 [Saprolegnia parasitica CBS 223.65]|eukprot:XP_012208282.1 hypothetical protein SPRG_13958 [Saprolegnia parasitica CBS 223.65]
MRCFLIVLLALVVATNATFDFKALQDKVLALLRKAEHGALDAIIDAAAKQHSGGAMRFRILQIPDLHYTNLALYPCDHKPDAMQGLCVEAYMTTMVAKMLDDVKPDFVVFTGDQLEALHFPQTWLGSLAAVNTYAAEVEKRKIPWAMVFGNHDENYLFANKRVMMAYIESLPYSYAKYGPYGIGGVGNYELRVAAGAASLDLYFLDTGKDGAVSDGQKALLRSFAASHAPEKAPALAFYHIPVPEYNDFNGTGQGTKGEAVSSGVKSTGLFDTMVQMGDVKASFCGHDHFNDYCFLRGLVHLCYGGGVGYGAAYAKGDHPRTARVIEWSVSSTNESIATWLYKHNTKHTDDKYFVHQRDLTTV